MGKLKEAELTRIHLNFRANDDASCYQFHVRRLEGGRREASPSREPHRNSFIGSSGTIDLPGIARRKGSCRTCGIVFSPNHVRECIFSSLSSLLADDAAKSARPKIYLLPVPYASRLATKKNDRTERIGARISSKSEEHA